MTGIICIDKEKDITSFGVVAKVRGILKEKKAGHTGTLDPMATGVLPIMLGGATKFLNFLPESDKGYTASFVLGKTTDTFDITGRITSENEVHVLKADVEEALSGFRGKMMQLPPMFSAKSHDGVRLYDLARKGIEVERKPCEIEIKKLKLIRAKDKEYTIDVVCSKGTYIRSLINDIGKTLGCGAVMTELRRTLACGFNTEKAVTVKELQRRKNEGLSFDDLIFSVEEIFRNYKKVCVSSAQAKRFSNGGALDIKRIKTSLLNEEVCAVYSTDDVFLGLGKSSGTELKALRLLVNR